MLKDYRRRFVLLTMLLVGAVLFAVFVGLGVYLHRETVNNLHMTMEQALRPWNEPTDIFLTLPEGAQPLEERPEAPPGEAPPPLSLQGPGTTEGLSLTSVFYDRESGEIQFLSDRETPDAERLSEAVKAAVEREESFGTLADYGLVYLREGMGEGWKLALVEQSWLAFRTWRVGLLLAGVFLLLLAVFFVLSLWLSRLAARPMEQAIERERQFVADASHDLKTPITVILANDSILRANPELSPAERRQWLDSTDEAAHGMMKLVEEMLTLSALESPDAPKAALLPTDLSSAAEKAALQLESVAWEKGVALETELAEGVTVPGSPEQLGRICGGLIENAIKYEPAGGAVRVTLEQAKKKAVFTVHNRGSVISPENQEHIFERFYRGDKARDLQKGHGLGLPIIKRLTELLGAELEVQSGEGEGTVFTVRFNCAE